MAFTQFSQPVQRPDMYKPLSDEVILAQGKARYDRADQEAQKIGSTYNSLFGISTYGKDAEVLSQMQEQFKQQVGELSKQGLANPEVNSRINQLITQYSSDPDVLSVHKRKASLDQELTAKKEAEAKGNQYLCPICEQADEYYASGKYVRDKTFNQTGWLDPNVEKLKREGLKDVQKIKKTVLKNGVYITTEEYDPEQLSSLYKGIYSNPNVQKTMDYSFEKKYKNYDFATEGVKKFQSIVDQANLQKQNAWEAMQKNLHTSAKYIQAQHDMTEADEYITKYSSLLQNPGNLGENFKTQIKQDELNNLISEDIKGAQFSSEVDVKESGFALNNQRYQQDKQMELYKAVLPGAVALGTTPEAILSGKARFADGTIVTPAHAVQKTHELKMEEEQAKSDEILRRGIALQENAEENKEEYTDKYGNKVPGAKKEIVREDVSSFRDMYNQNKDKVTEALKAKAGRLGFNFDDGDIEKVTWNKDTKRYEVAIDDFNYLGAGAHTISFTQDEMDALKGNTTTSSTSKPLDTTYQDKIKTDALNAYIQQNYAGDNTKLTNEDIEYLKKKYPK